MLTDNVPFADDDEGEAFEFDDSGDDISEADRLPPAPPPLQDPSSKDQSQDKTVASSPEDHLPKQDPPAPSTTSNTASSPTDATDAADRPSTTGGATAEGEGTSAAEGTDDMETDLPPPPSPPPDDDTQTDPARTGLQPKSVNTSFLAQGK